MIDKQKNKDSDTYDLSPRNDESATRVAREQESDSANENTGLEQISSGKGDRAGENKVATSLDNE